MKAESHILFALASVFLAFLMLFYIFDNISKLSERCSKETLEICSEMSGLTIPMLIFLLIIGGFVLIISIVVYILISA